MLVIYSINLLNIKLSYNAAYFIALIIMQTHTYYSISMCEIQSNIYDNIIRKIDDITNYNETVINKLIYSLVLLV